MDALVTMTIEHDRIFGANTGLSFTQGPYYADLERAVRARLKPDIDAIEASNRQMETERQQRQASLKAEGDRLRDAAYDCTTREATRLARTSETADAVAGAAMVFCRPAIEIAVAAVARASGATLTDDLRKDLERIVRSNVAARVMSVRADMQAAAPTAPQQQPPATTQAAASPPSAAMEPMQRCLTAAISGAVQGRLTPRDLALTAALDVCRPEIEMLGRTLVVERREATLDKAREVAFSVAKRTAETLLDN